jgi:hypothetical protein
MIYFNRARSLNLNLNPINNEIINIVFLNYRLLRIKKCAFVTGETIERRAKSNDRMRKVIRIIRAKKDK